MPWSISASSSSIITGYLKLVKKVTTGQPIKLSISSNRVALVALPCFISVKTCVITATGRLRFADSTKDEQAIKLIDDDNKQHVIVVPGGMMSDIVKPLWDERVQITGTQISTGQRNKNKIKLLDIEKVVEGEDD